MLKIIFNLTDVMCRFCVTNIYLCQTYVFCRNIFDQFGLVENDLCEDNSKWISINIMNNYISFLFFGTSIKQYLEFYGNIHP